MGIDKSELTSKELEAKYALLLSQALDKNYIDLQSDSIIAPAVRYYENHGTPDERLLTHYYRGVIYLNDGDRESAMESYIKAERYIDECRDYGVIARLYTAKMNLYQYAYDFASALEQEEIASSGDDGLRRQWDLCCRDYTSIVFGPEFTIYSVKHLHFCPPIICKGFYQY